MRARRKTDQARIVRLTPRPSRSPIVRDTAAMMDRLPPAAQRWVAGIVHALDRLWSEYYAQTERSAPRPNIGKPVITIDGDDREGA